MSHPRLTNFTRFLGPVLDALRALGGSARSAQVKDHVLNEMHFSEVERNDVLASGVSRLGNQIDWARFYLAKSGLLDSSKRGVWALTEKGKNARLSDGDARTIAREVNSQLKPDHTHDGNEDKQREGSVDETLETQLDHRPALLSAVRALSPKGFEEICRYLLLESGFEEVTVTGQSGDGGIDGHGVLRVSKLVSMKVLFQCKRIVTSVSAGIVRDFRGALSGRAEKGIILTTGYFTASAEQEAKRDGVVPIELVDGDRLVELFEEVEIGLKNPRTVFDVDHDFFKRFT